jgi:tRNA-2-methylthio-N6-dimethylallyladenosine synthase
MARTSWSYRSSGQRCPPPKVERLPLGRREEGREVPKSFKVVTYGCQMNTHDSERISGLLESAGYVRAAGAGQPDVVVFNTCAVRENADNRLYGNLGHLRPVKDAHPGMQIAVGGCLAQKDRGDIVRRAPWVDVVFGTHNIGSLPVLLERARHNNEAQVEILEALEVFPSSLPARRESTYAGWVSISVGCNNTCTFCIVPALRGKEKDRRPGEILAEVGALVDDGVLEVTFLGQNVNSYGAEFGDRYAFGKLLRACGGLAEAGLERVRFTSPHPKDFTDDVIEAMAATPNVCHQLHMPMQSGSDAVLKAMRRSYRSEKYLGIIDRVRTAMPDAAITTDIIVGFPGETERDFQDTLDAVHAARFAGAFTFQYSRRPGTPAAEMAGQVPKAVVQERYDRLVAAVEEVTWAENRQLIGDTVEVLVAVGEGRKDGATGRMSGRARDGRLVHFTAPAGNGQLSTAPAGNGQLSTAPAGNGQLSTAPAGNGQLSTAPAGNGQLSHGAAEIRPGDVVHTTITYAAPHHLNADGPVVSHRRTRAGDVWEAGLSPRTPAVSLGLPTVGAPPAVSSAAACGA